MGSVPQRHVTVFQGAQVQRACPYSHRLRLKLPPTSFFCLPLAKNIVRACMRCLAGPKEVNLSQLVAANCRPMGSRRTFPRKPMLLYTVSMAWDRGMRVRVGV